MPYVPWCHRCRTHRCGKVFGPIWDSVCLRTAFTRWNVPEKYGLHGELFFFLTKKKEPMVLSELIDFRPCISADTVKACASIGLHMTADENAFGWTVTLLLIQATRGSMVAQKVVCAATALNGQEVRVLLLHNVGNLALEVVGQNGSSEVISLFRSGGVALSCHLSTALLCKEMRDACL